MDRVDTVNDPVVEPAVIVTLAGTVAMKGMLLIKFTFMPPTGAGPVKVTVPVEVPPPATVLGFSDSEYNAVLDVMVRAADLYPPL